MSVSIGDVQQLIARKDELEAQIKAYYDVLEDQKNIGMDGPLVDIEGYPRADVDVYQIRTARHNIIWKLFATKEYIEGLLPENGGHINKPGLQNDHQAIMKEIEEALHSLHARDKDKSQKDEAEAQAEALQRIQALPEPFARVDSVTPGSPASLSGLQVGDEIIAFGTVKSNNFQNLQNIATVVQHSEGKPLSVTVIRDGKPVNLGLVPQRWSGKGLLGCNIIPTKR